MAVTIWAWPQQIERGCWLGEWPFEEGCPEQTAGALNTATPQQLLEHLQRNVGDSRAYVWLAAALASPDVTAAAPLLPWVAQLAPHHNKTLAMQAAAALQTANYDDAVKAVALLVERGQTAFRASLVAMMLDPATQDAVRRQLTSESRWLDATLASAGPKVPPDALQSFVVDGWKLGVVRTDTALAQIERLKQAGHWHDAYNLWVLVLGKVPDGLYNPGFDQRASQRGFDWSWSQEANAKSGLYIAQVSASPSPGNLLQVEMTGRAALPQALVTQPLILLGSRYQLRGRYKSGLLRSREGLIWALRCADGVERFAASEPLKETQKLWKNLDFTFTVPDECDGAVKLQLEATAPWEARAGMSGLMSFDDFELRVQPRQTP